MAVIYTPQQLSQYFAHISFPGKDHSSDRLEFLTQLVQHHIARVPFDSIALHYSPHRLVSLDPDDLFHKIVDNSRGGYCMEVNAFFATVLRSLDFRVYSAGGRVKHERWNHMVNIVTIKGQKYLVDVGFGAKEPIRPVPLQHGVEVAGVGPVRGKLELGPLGRHAQQDKAGQQVWKYSTRADASADWEEMYSFVEVEFFPEDFEVMNYFVMTRPQSFFVQTVLAYRVIMSQEGELVGEMILHKNTVKEVRDGASRVLQELRAEEERVEALEKYFFIKLTDRERVAIKGLASELRAPEA